MKKSYKTLRLVLGDQLNAEHSWFSEKSSDVLYLIAELPQEASYVKHHIQKISAFFLAMQNFAKALKKAGHEVLHLTLDDTAEHKSLDAVLKATIKDYKIEIFEYQRPDEYRLLDQLRTFCDNIDVESKQADSEHFLLPFDDIDTYFAKDSHVKMEFFYRKMRKRFDILMDGKKPEGGDWNYDSENRNKLKKDDLEKIPKPLVFSNDVGDILKRLEAHKIKTFGKAEEKLGWPCSRKQAKDLLAFFCEESLANFGTFQDSMTKNSKYQWSLFHSRLSFAMNSKMISPKTIINSAVKAYRDSEGEIDIAQIEGFVRQILGWREYMRGVYWANMPQYSSKNALNAQRGLPDFFWSGDTKMSCMSTVIHQSLDYAYAHHIQRLMITGNFCMLTGINPNEVDEWYLGIYIDAIEWVEMPNTRGMSQFADGGIVATKPYSGGGNYINKMSDYCKGCHYKVTEKTGDDACPFNSLYWDFMARHRERFENNPRIGMIYRNWDKQDDAKKEATLERGQWCREHLDSL